MDLFKAHDQWATRPADERFWDLKEMYAQCLGYQQTAAMSTVQYGDLRVEADAGEMRMLGKESVPARLTHWAFGQLASRVRAPASYLRKLPATLAAQNLNHGLKEQREPQEKARLLLHLDNGSSLVRCMTGLGYTRIWNYEIVSRLQGLEEYGWRVPPARPARVKGERTRIATEADCLRGHEGWGWGVKPGDQIAPAGLYASDKDMFVFMVDDDHVIDNPASPDAPLARGFFFWNSEVGDRSVGGMKFLYDGICGNHICWNVESVAEFRFAHVGRVRDRTFDTMQVELKEYANSSASEDEALIAKAQSYVIAASKDDVLKELLGYIGKKKIRALNRNLLGDAYDIAEQEPRYGDPNTPWAITQGLTVLSQECKHADQRTHIDQAAGQILEIAF